MQRIDQAVTPTYHKRKPVSILDYHLLCDQQSQAGDDAVCDSGGDQQLLNRVSRQVCLVELLATNAANLRQYVDDCHLSGVEFELIGVEEEHGCLDRRAYHHHHYQQQRLQDETQTHVLQDCL